MCVSVWLDLKSKEEEEKIGHFFITTQEQNYIFV